MPATLTSVPGVTPATTYTVVNGDNLSVVAKKHKITVSELAAANNLKPAAMLAVGKKLIIPGKAATPARNSATTSAGENGSAPAAASTAPAVAKTSGDAIPHTIKPGENLGAIAKKYGVKVGEIAVANNITDPKNIRSGQVLMIPGWQTPAAKTPKSSSATTQAREPSAAANSAKPASVGAPPLLVPPPGQDLDAGLKISPTSDVPVIKVEESPASPPKNF